MSNASTNREQICVRVRPQLVGYWQHQLSNEDDAFVAEHLAGCEECEDLLSQHVVEFSSIPAPPKSFGFSEKAFRGFLRAHQPRSIWNLIDTGFSRLTSKIEAFVDKTQKKMAFVSFPEGLLYPISVSPVLRGTQSADAVPIESNFNLPAPQVDLQIGIKLATSSDAKFRLELQLRTTSGQVPSENVFASLVSGDGTEGKMLSNGGAKFEALKYDVEYCLRIERKKKKIEIPLRING